MKYKKSFPFGVALLVSSFAFAEVTISEDLKVTGGLQITGTNGLLIKATTTSTLAPAWVASFSGTANVLAWYPNKGALRVGRFSASELANTNIGTGSFAIKGSASPENSVNFGGRLGGSNSFVQGSSFAEGPYTAVFGESSSGYGSRGAFAAGRGYADSFYSVAFGNAVAGRGGAVNIFICFWRILHTRLSKPARSCRWNSSDRKPINFLGGYR